MPSVPPDPADIDQHLMWNPVPFVDIVVEYLAGTRVNKNGQCASSSQIQSGWTLKF
jgi:hypothetical protein